MHLVTKLQRHKGFVRFVSHEALGDLLLKSCAPLLGQRALAETVHRAWLFAGDVDGFSHMNQFEYVWGAVGMPSEVVATLVQWCRCQHAERDYNLPPGLADWASAPLRQEMEILLHGWQQADGLIAFVSSESQCLPAVALPFRISEGGGAHGPRATGRSGACCDLELDEGMLSAVQGARSGEWIGKRDTFGIEFTTLKGKCGVPVSGASCGLPVLIARGLRAKGLRVPPFDLAVSGTLACGGTCLELQHDVHLRQQKEGLLRSMGVKRMILPGGGDGSGWPCGQDIAPRLKALFEEFAPTAERDTHDALLAKVKQHASALHLGHQPAGTVERIIRMTLADDLRESDHRLADVRAEAMLVLSACLSHLGRPAEAQRISEQAMTLADRLPPLWHGHALIRLAVILQDLGDYPAAAGLCDQAVGLSDHAADEWRALELDMKASGTKGQVLASWSLCGNEARAAEALKLLQHARQCAHRLDSQGQPGTEPEEPRNIAYVYWWHTLHAPEKAQEFWSTAWDAAERKDRAGTTQQFLLRHRWLAVYRSMIVGGRLPHWVTCGQSFAMPGSGWLHSTARKYRGTWHAFEGRTEAAVEDFNNAIEQLQNKQGEQSGISLFDFFAATTALQAGQSLQHLDPDRSIAFLQQALSLFDACEAHMPWFQGSPFAGNLWIKRAKALMAGNEPAENPQLYYPY